MGDARTYYEELQDAEIAIEVLKEKLRILEDCLGDLIWYDETPDRLPMIEDAREALKKADAVT